MVKTITLISRLASGSEQRLLPLIMVCGAELLIDAHGCNAQWLRDAARLRSVCERIIADLRLCTVATPLWHEFPPPGGVTGMYLLSESHLTCHTWPEERLVTFNLFCCRGEREWPWEAALRELLAAQQVSVRRLVRGAAGVEVRRELAWPAP